MLAKLALPLLLAPAGAVRVDQAAVNGAQPSSLAETEASFNPHAPANVPAFSMPRVVPAAPPVFGMATRPLPAATTAGSALHAFNLDDDTVDSFGLYDLSKDMFDRVKKSNVSFFQGEVGDKMLRFGVASSKLLPQPVLIAERLEGKGKKATWVSLPVQAYTRQRDSGSGVDILGADWTKAEASVAEQLLGTWKPPVAAVADAIAALALTWSPKSITFSLDTNGDLVVRAEGEEEAPLKPKAVTFDSYFADKNKEVRSRLKLDKAEKLFDDLKDAKSPTEAWDALFKMARNINKDDDDEEEAAEGAKGGGEVKGQLTGEKEEADQSVVDAEVVDGDDSEEGDDGKGDRK